MGKNLFLNVHYLPGEAGMKNERTLSVSSVYFLSECLEYSLPFFRCLPDAVLSDNVELKLAEQKPLSCSWASPSAVQRPCIVRGVALTSSFYLIVKSGGDIKSARVS